MRAIGGTSTEPYSQIYATLVSAIRSSSTSILLANAYFDPDPQLLGAIEDAAGAASTCSCCCPASATPGS